MAKNLITQRSPSKKIFGEFLNLVKQQDIINYNHLVLKKSKSADFTKPSNDHVQPSLLNKPPLPRKLYIDKLVKNIYTPSSKKQTQKQSSKNILSKVVLIKKQKENIEKIKISKEKQVKPELKLELRGKAYSVSTNYQTKSTFHSTLKSNQKFLFSPRQLSRHEKTKSSLMMPKVIRPKLQKQNNSSICTPASQLTEFSFRKNKQSRKLTEISYNRYFRHIE